ncbi:MAG: hypothetical protein MUF51_10395 [Vicinamibacteria bacterium]|nr:hypothetical protein [Vicinamibacteria bacterium]
MKMNLRLSLVCLLAGLTLCACSKNGSDSEMEVAEAAPLASPNTTDLSQSGDNPNAPGAPVKLIFIHHSTGGNWLADPDGNELGGGLGRTLRDNNYYVSATNYGWSVDGDSIGDRTDIGNWWEWFRGPQSGRITAALYAESGQNFGDFGSWPRLASAPAGENRIILFKSCFPNSELHGSATAAPPAIGNNPLRGVDAGSEHMTVANAKGIYIDLLEYFRTRNDKLFIVVTAPPLTQSGESANARAFNNWLAKEWLVGYALKNVAVFDYYNVLTSNGGNANTNDLGSADGNHHRYWNNAVQHQIATGRDTLAYPSGDDHPSRAGNEKATAEFIKLLNIYFHRWAG